MRDELQNQMKTEMQTELEQQKLNLQKEVDLMKQRQSLVEAERIKLENERIKY